MNSDSALVHIVEVKTCQNPDWQIHRVTQRQRSRLMRARTLLENSWKRPIALHLAVVSQGEEVTVIEDICS